MKKKILVLLMILIVSLVGVHETVYANEVMPCFNVVASVDTAIGITGSRIDFIIDVYTDNSSDLDRVHVDAELKRGSGVVAAVYDTDLTKDGRVFTFESYKKATVTGVYYLQYTLKCYKNGVLKDTISGTTKNVAYIK